MRKLAVILVAAGIVLGIFAAAHWRTKRSGLISVSVSNRVGLSPAPQLILTDLSGKTFNTASLDGKIVVVNFWAAWCTPCADEVPKFVALQQKYQDQGVQVVGISIDDAEDELRDFYRRYGMNYPVIPGSQSIAQAYGGILGLPTTFIIGRDRRIQKKLTGSTDFGVLEQEVVALLARKADSR